jgi:hypothetical protein
MPIRFRLALIFTAAAAVLFALGSWLLVSVLSASLLSAIDAQLATRLSGAGQYLARRRGSRGLRRAGHRPVRAGQQGQPGCRPGADDHSGQPPSGGQPSADHYRC